MRSKPFNEPQRAGGPDPDLSNYTAELHKMAAEVDLIGFSYQHPVLNAAIEAAHRRERQGLRVVPRKYALCPMRRADRQADQQKSAWINDALAQICRTNEEVAAATIRPCRPRMSGFARSSGDLKAARRQWPPAADSQSAEHRHQAEICESCAVQFQDGRTDPRPGGGQHDTSSPTRRQQHGGRGRAARQRPCRSDDEQLHQEEQKLITGIETTEVEQSAVTFF